jgi:hypothetical protein
VQRLFEAVADSSECLVSVELLTEIQPNEAYSIASRNSFQFYGLVTSVPRCFGCRQDSDQRIFVSLKGSYTVTPKPRK